MKIPSYQVPNYLPWFPKRFYTILDHILLYYIINIPYHKVPYHVLYTIYEPPSMGPP